MSRIWVESEFAPLRTVVLARSEVCLTAAMHDPDMWFLPEGPDRRVADASGVR